MSSFVWQLFEDVVCNRINLLFETVNPSLEETIPYAKLRNFRWYAPPHAFTVCHSVGSPTPKTALVNDTFTKISQRLPSAVYTPGPGRIDMFFFSIIRLSHLRYRL